MAHSMKTFLSQSELTRMVWNTENNILVVYSKKNVMIPTCDTCLNSNFQCRARWEHFHLNFNPFSMSNIRFKHSDRHTISCKKSFGSTLVFWACYISKYGFEGHRIHFQNQILEGSTLTDALLAVS